MASDKIKGLTVKIGADTSDFVKELKKVDKEINLTNKQANELQKGLQLEFNESRFLEAQRLVRKSLEETEEKAKAIREQLKFLEDSGAVDTDGYKRLQTELYKTENSAVLLKQKLEDINNVKTTGISSKIKNFASNLKASAVVAGAVIGTLFKVAQNSAKAGGEIQDLADRLGVTAEQIQRYDYIAMQSGVDTEQLVKSMAKARDAIGTALTGTTNTATTALKKLFGDLSKIPTSTEDGFNAIIEQLSKVEDSTLQAYYANEIFGERLATDLIPYINNGSEKIRQLNAEFEDLGSLTNEEVQELADFDDKLNKINKQVQNLSYNLGSTLVPILEMLLQLIEPFIPMVQTLSDFLNPIIDKLVWLAKTIENSILGDYLKVAFGGGLPAYINLFGGGGKQSSDVYNDAEYNYTTPTNNTNTTSTNYTDNSTNNIEVIMPETTGNLEYDAKTLAEEVAKYFSTKKQSSGR